MPSPRLSSPTFRPSHFFSLSTTLNSKGTSICSYLRDNRVIFLLHSWQHTLVGQGDLNLGKKEDSIE